MKDPSTTDRINLPSIVWLVPAAVVLWAMLPVDNTYYDFARPIACSSAVLLAYREYKIHNETTGWTILFAMTAIVFNPFMPVHLPGTLWVAIDVCAGLLFFKHWRLRGQRKEEKQSY